MRIKLSSSRLVACVESILDHNLRTTILPYRPFYVFIYIRIRFLFYFYFIFWCGVVNIIARPQSLVVLAVEIVPKFSLLFFFFLLLHKE